MIPCDHSPIPNEFQLVTALKIYSGNVALWDEEFDIFEGFEMEQEQQLTVLQRITSYPIMFNAMGDNTIRIGAHVEYSDTNNPNLGGCIRNNANYVEPQTWILVTNNTNKKFKISYKGGYDFMINGITKTQPAKVKTPVYARPYCGLILNEASKNSLILTLYSIKWSKEGLGTHTLKPARHISGALGLIELESGKFFTHPDCS